LVDTEWVGKARERAQPKRSEVAWRRAVAFTDEFEVLQRDLLKACGHVGPAAVARMAVQWCMEHTEPMNDHRALVLKQALAEGPQVIVWVDGVKPGAPAKASVLSWTQEGLRYLPASIATTKLRKALARSANPFFDEVLHPRRCHERLDETFSLMGDKVTLRFEHTRDNMRYPRGTKSN
jgi:hypothetical protein